MYRVTGLKDLRDQISDVFAFMGIELTGFDVLSDDHTTLYILRASNWDFYERTCQEDEFWDKMEEVLPDAECICSQMGADAFIIYQEEQ